MNHEEKASEDYLWNEDIPFHTYPTEQLEAFWTTHIKNKRYYHGTNDKAWQHIQKEGQLSPENRFWGTAFYELEQLLIKAGNEEGYGTRREGKFFLTSEHSKGRNYANGSPEAWSYFIGREAWDNRDKKQAIERFQEYLIYGYFFGKQVADAKTMLAQDKPDIANHTLLNEQDLKRAYVLFDEQWDFFKDCRPVLLSFSATCVENHFKEKFISDFSQFKEMVKKHQEKITWMLPLLLLNPKFEFTEPLSLSYLVDVETPKNKYFSD